MLALVILAIGGLVPTRARAGDRVEVVVTDAHQGDGNDSAEIPGTAAPPGSWSSTQTVQITHTDAPTQVGERPAAAPTNTTWFGLSLGAVTMPMSRGGLLPARERMGVNPMRACLGGGDRRICTPLRGADLRLQFFGVDAPALYPRMVGYLRTGYETGGAMLQPTATGPVPGEATSIAYSAVPVSVGFNLYAFKRFPVRPFVGVGAGADVVRLRYTRRDEAALRKTFASPSVEVHGGVEVRIANYVALTAEVRQQWGGRKKLAGVPDFTNTGFALITGLTVSVPRGTFAQRHRGSHDVSVTHVSSSMQPPAPPRSRSIMAPMGARAAPVALPPVAPAPIAPAPASIAPAPAPIAPAPAPVAPAPAPVAPAPAAAVPLTLL